MTMYHEWVVDVMVSDVECESGDQSSNVQNPVDVDLGQVNKYHSLCASMGPP